MATDAWRAARDLILRWWRRAQPGRVETIAAELDASYEDAGGGTAAGRDPGSGADPAGGADPGSADPAGPGAAPGDPEAPEAAEGTADDPGDGPGDADTEAELRAQWQGLFRRALAACPAAADDLRRLLAELDALAAAAPARPPADQHVTVTQHATASGSARVLQAGRDQHIRER